MCVRNEKPSRMTATSQEFRRVRNADYSRSRFGAVIGRQNRVAAHTQRIVFVALVCTCGTGARTGYFARTKLEDLTAVKCVRGTDARPRAKLIDGLMELSISASLTQLSSHEYLKAMLPRRYSIDTVARRRSRTNPNCRQLRRCLVRGMLSLLWVPLQPR